MTPDVQRYVDGIIGAPWVRDRRNCWRLTREIVALLGYELPVVLEVAPRGRAGRALKHELFAHHPERANWIEVAKPATGWAGVLMHKAHRPADEIDHAGVYFAEHGGRVLHIDAPHGVVYDSLPELRLRGWAAIFLVPSLRAQRSNPDRDAGLLRRLPAGGSSQ